MTNATITTTMAAATAITAIFLLRLLALMLEGLFLRIGRELMSRIIVAFFI
jgi:hypothetical protein